MKIWGISDTHLSNNYAGTMEMHGQIWAQHRQKIIKNWQATVDQNDIVLVGGDITWAYTIKQAISDIRMLNDLPCMTIVIVNGNHDTWWKDYEEVCKNVPKSVKPISGNAIEVNGQVNLRYKGMAGPQ